MKTIPTNEEIIAKFKAASIHMSKIETKGRENGMICVVYRDLPRFFPTYYCAFDHYTRKSVI